MNQNIGCPPNLSSEADTSKGRHLPVAEYYLIKKRKHLNKKRKLPAVESAAEQSGPSKHKCFLPISVDGSGSSSTNSLETSESAITSNVKAVLETIHDLPGVESAEDSNESYTSPVIKLGVIYEKEYSDEDSTSFSFIARDKCQDTELFTNEIQLDDAAGKEEPHYITEVHSPLEQNAAIHESDYLMDHFLPYGNYPNYDFKKDGEQESDDEIGSFVYSDGLSGGLSALPLGSFSVSQEDRMGAIQPTIDQEFEQYFSKLML